MGAVAVGTRLKKFHCQCVMESGEELFIAIKASSEGQASFKVHEGYNIEYVVDILTPLQMEYKKRHLRRHPMAGVSSLG